MAKHVHSSKSYNWGNQYGNGHVVKTNNWTRR